MASENNFHIGNRDQATLLVKEILPAIESLMLNANKEFFTIRDAMRILSVSRTQLYYLRTKGLLATKRVGRKVYITKEAIHNLVMNSDKT